MRILFSTYSFQADGGGVERSVFNLATSLIARGHQVTVVTHSPATFLYSFRRDQSLPILSLNIRPPSLFRRLGRLRSLLRHVINGVILVACCKLWRIEVVHCQFLNVDTGYARWISRFLRIPHVVTLRGSETAEWVLGDVLRKRYVRNVLRAAHHITAVSRSLLVDAEPYCPAIARKASVIPNPVNPGLLHKQMAAPSGEQDGRSEYLLYVGRLVDSKDVGCLVDSYHRILAEDETFRPDLVIVGNGTEAEPLKQRALSRPGRDRIFFLGRRSYPETLRLIRQALLLVLPSRHEGCPNVVLEAMALGTPVIVSNAPGLTEMIEHGATGSIFPVGNRQELAMRILELYRSSPLRARYTTRARAWVENRHAFETILNQYETLYSGLMSGCR